MSCGHDFPTRGRLMQTVCVACLKAQRDRLLENQTLGTALRLIAKAGDTEVAERFARRWALTSDDSMSRFWLEVAEAIREAARDEV